MEIVTLGGGCFWCLETLFLDLRGVQSVRSGYSGGSELDPTYEEVCSGTTGHAEVVQVGFDPAVITFPEILEVFFAMHDPTTLNRQGADVGTQYRSAIFFHSPEQEGQARASIAEVEAEGVWDGPIITEITPFSGFYSAGAYHEDYFRRNSDQPYCQAVINPKVAKFRSRFSHKLKSRSE
jgi:peptide-methionine (S)-S-oxide reductase